jgi:hypothetical protein
MLIEEAPRRGILSKATLPSDKPRIKRIRRVRDLYRCQRLSQWALDLLVRTLSCVGDWCQSTADGIDAGYKVFHSCREMSRDTAKKRPPIHVEERDAEAFLADRIESGEVAWR